MPNNTDSATPTTIRIAKPNHIAMICRLGGKTVALPYSAYIELRSPDGANGRLRYLAADGTVALYFQGEELRHVHEYPLVDCQLVWGGIALRALRDLLATDPEPMADLDAITTELEVA